MNTIVTTEDEKRVKAMGFLRNRGTDNFSGRVITVNGMINAAQQKCIGEAAEIYGNGNVCFTSRLTIEVQGIPYDKIPDFQQYIKKENLVTGGTGAKVRPVVSCKGTTCQYGLIDTFHLSEKIHKHFFEGYSQVQLPHKFKIAVGGCPNSCVKPDLNDVGIVGQRRPVVDESLCKGCKRCTVQQACPMGAASVTENLVSIDPEICNNCGRCLSKCVFHAFENFTSGYQIYIGGRWGKNVARGKSINHFFTTEQDVLDMVEQIILLYREKGHAGERLSQMIERLGFNSVETELLSGDILKRKATILESQLTPAGGALK